MLEKCADASPGAVLALHSNGDLLQWHPHIHSIALAGAFLPDGSFLHIEINQEQLTDRFAKLVLDSLLKTDLINQDIIDNMNSWEHSGFNVHIGDVIPYSDTESLLFHLRQQMKPKHSLSSYLRKCPVSNNRITLLNPEPDCKVEFHSYKNDEHTSKTFEPLEFLAALSSHIPDRWEQTTRFMGTAPSGGLGVKILLM